MTPRRSSCGVGTAGPNERLPNMFRNRKQRGISCASSAAPLEYPIRLMHVIDALELAGMEYGVVKLTNRLDPSLFSTSICCLRHQTEGTRALLRPGIEVVELHRKPGLDCRVILRLSSLLRSRRVHIVHSHNWSTFLYSVIAATLARTPVLVHGEHGREAQATRRRQLLLSRLLSKHVDRVATVSADLARELIPAWGIRPEKVAAIPNGVDLERFGPVGEDGSLRLELGLTAENRVILNVGRLRPVKDPRTLMRAFARTYREFPQVRLLLVGSDHGTGMRSDLETLATSLGLESAVCFLGVRHDIPRLLSLSDVYVNSSVFEGMSNTILEAMAAGKPIVASAVGGNAEIVRDGETGYLFPVGDEHLLAAHLLNLLRDSSLRKRMGQAARDEVERKHQISTMVNAYSSLYQELLARHTWKGGRVRTELLKKGLAHALKWTGASYLRQSARSDHLTILAYHRVLPMHEADRYPFASMVMPRDQFEAQMAHFASHCSPMALPEAIERLQSQKLPHRALVVTLDDGYRDNFDHAFPILSKYRIPATFFVVSGIIGDGALLWWDAVATQIKAIVLQRMHRNEAEARRFPGWMLSILHDPDCEHDLPLTIRRIVTRLNFAPASGRLEALRLLQSMAGGERSGSPSLMLSWDELRELDASGMTIGSHTTSHAFLDELEAPEASQQIGSSTRALAAALGHPVRYFAYPAGRFNRQSPDLLRGAGIEAALTMLPGTNRATTDLYRLRRFDAGYSYLRTGFSPAVLDMELQGWLYPLRPSPMTQPYT